MLEFAILILLDFTIIYKEGVRRFYANPIIGFKFICGIVVPFNV